MIPLYAVLLWTYFDPEGAVFLGRRWMYKEEPELSEVGIRYTKIASVITMVIITIKLIYSLF
jgi:hypothetical protein